MRDSKGHSGGAVRKKVQRIERQNKLRGRSVGGEGKKMGREGGEGRGQGRRGGEERGSVWERATAHLPRKGRCKETRSLDSIGRNGSGCVRRGGTIESLSGGITGRTEHKFF